ncbi:SDR family oxidoreductase [Rhodococcus sp. IEGM 1307]|uniref:SDR family NAD(P)-dependent oxidoreductase n=1 Tax=Rhodococcus sp. IEGM 1307 TaxID=3047091 RepID=UPI0024B71922|nr:SDR family oxidoreductase [Rhodococcus sp. IEGM 1307]MDI9978715.1 SDR family oxidoreductase [Rhodococcus sp. IEGM 1307]
MTRPLAVVSGAAGDLGRAITSRFLADGYAVVALERTEKLCAAARTGVSGPFLALAADQTDRAQVEDALTTAVEWGGGPSAVAANAGYAKYGPILTMLANTWNRHIDVNLTGTFYLCQVSAQRIADRRQGGSLTILGSSLALAHSDQVGGYCVSKAALLPLMRTFAAELGDDKIRANAVLPGVVEAEMTRSLLDENGIREDLIDHTPCGRLGTPDDIAEAVAYLASPAASGSPEPLCVSMAGKPSTTNPNGCTRTARTPSSRTGYRGLDIVKLVDSERKRGALDPRRSSPNRKVQELCSSEY